MKAWKRLGAAVITLLALTAVLTGTALAAEPEDAGIVVQLNGEPIAFTDAVPESVSGRTFIPLRAVMEAMDAQVDYDGQTGTVTISRDGTQLSMALARSSITVTENGQTRDVVMDVSPYVKNDRTYVPVRFVAEAFGCNVGFDMDARTVIIVDVDALLGDATFDLMDNFSAYCNKQGKNRNMTVNGTLDLSAADKTGAVLPAPVTAKGSIDGITGDKGVQMNWELKLSGLSDLLAGFSDDPLEQMVMQQMIAALSDLKGEVRMDLEAGMAYLTLPAALTGGAEDTWYSMDFGAYQTELLGALDMTKLTQLQEAGIREVLAAIIRSMPLDDSQTSYEGVAMVTAVYVEMLSDQAFVQKGNSYVAQMTLEDMMNMTVTLTKRGNDIVAADIKMDCNVSEDGETVTMTMTEHAAPDKVTAEIEMAVEADDVSMKLSLDLNCVPTSKAPVTTPPAGAQIVPMS